ncbi:hypothetical protein GZH46_02703 [Fragariocoptes setiger]|uniref:Gustatory receptor n=1 Tax=Fragariocoptes setiger TaxID=1670756 RepID=A0ABQ7S5U8_9ACAR|nr:hypothetical protein GZH46_02703 [Fragariocoptes setiger]
MASESRFNCVWEKLTLISIEATELTLFNYILGVDIDFVCKKSKMNLDSLITTIKHQQQEIQCEYFNNSNFKKFFLSPIVAYARFVLLSVIMASQSLISRSDSMSDCYWLGDTQYFNRFSWPSSVMMLMVAVTSLAKLISRRQVPKFEIKILKKAFDDAKLCARNKRNGDKNERPFYNLSSSNDTISGLYCWLSVSNLMLIMFGPIVVLALLIVMELIQDFPIPVHGGVCQMFITIEASFSSILNSSHCFIITHELSTRLCNIRKQLDKTIFNYNVRLNSNGRERNNNNCYPRTDDRTMLTRSPSPSRYSQAGNTSVDCYKYLSQFQLRQRLPCVDMIARDTNWHCAPDCDDWICLELRRLGLALSLVMNDISRSNDYWKLGLFIQIVYQMSVAVLCAYFAFNTENLIEIWFCASGATAAWCFIVILWLVGSMVNAEITQVRQMLLRRLQTIDESHRYLAFKIYTVVSNIEVGYSVLDFFQITHLSALILFGWFGSAIVLTLTYFEESGTTQFMLSSKRNDFVNNAPRPFWQLPM